jgi:DNA-binding transcriptional ArsR family regulator
MPDREAVFAALGSEVRLRMLELIAAHKEMCICELVDEFDMVQSAVSSHMQRLKRAGLATERRSGFRIFYRVVPDVMEAAFEALEESIRTKLAGSEHEDPEARVEARLAAAATG